MDSDRVRELWDCLSDVDFRTRSRNPDWFKSVVVSMLLGPGNQDAIEERAIEVVRALGLAGITFPTGRRPWFHPSFHLGYDGPRAYHEDHEHRVGENHSFNDLGVYCATHDRPWSGYGTIGNSCMPSCRYGMRGLECLRR